MTRDNNLRDSLVFIGIGALVIGGSLAYYRSQTNGNGPVPDPDPDPGPDPDPDPKPFVSVLDGTVTSMVIEPTEGPAGTPFVVDSFFNVDARDETGAPVIWVYRFVVTMRPITLNPAPDRQQRLMLAASVPALDPSLARLTFHAPRHIGAFSDPGLDMFFADIDLYHLRTDQTAVTPFLETESNWVFLDSKESQQFGYTFEVTD